ncbi:hypothetical protein SH449x_000878 [Pirellulaceae bacterium SH449]
MTPYHKLVTAFTQRLTRFWQLTGGAVSDIVADRSADPILRIPQQNHNKAIRFVRPTYPTAQLNSGRDRLRFVRRLIQLHSLSFIADA